MGGSRSQFLVQGRQNYRLSPKSALYFATSFSGQSDTASNLPTKKRSTLGSSTNLSPPIRSLFLYSQCMRSITNLVCDRVNTLRGKARRSNSISESISLPFSSLTLILYHVPYPGNLILCKRLRQGLLRDTQSEEYEAEIALHQYVPQEHHLA